jgi:hypothetical protein
VLWFYKGSSYRLDSFSQFPITHCHYIESSHVFCYCLLHLCRWISGLEKLIWDGTVITGWLFWPLTCPKAIKCILRKLSLHWLYCALCIIAVRYFQILYVQFHLWCCCLCLIWEAGHCQWSEWLTFIYLVIVIIIAMSSCWIIAFPTTCLVMSVFRLLRFLYYSDLSC